MIDGEAITLKDVEKFSNSKDPRRLFQLNQQLFEFRESMLGLLLGERLLKLAANEAGTTVDEFLASVLKVDPASETEIQEILDRQPAGQVDPAVVRPLIKQFLEDRKREEARARYIAHLIAKAKKAPRPVVIKLQPPRQAIPIAGTDPSRGTGPVEVIEFSDFECPYCQKVQPVLKEVLTQFDGKVKHVWKDFPLPMHPNAVAAAMAARCAQEQGKFWEYHDMLFANQQALTPSHLKQHAAVVGLDSLAFDACLDRGKYRDQINTARKDAAGILVPATPTVFINGRLVSGVAAKEEYARIISDELGAASD
jgi:protein-disulfide isomerase